MSFGPRFSLGWTSIRATLSRLYHGAHPGAAPQGAPAQPSVSRGTSLAEHLFVLVAAVAIPLIFLGGGALWLQYRSQREAAETQLVEQARSTALLVDREFERTLAVAKTLAAAVPAAKGDLDLLEDELRSARDLLATTLPAGAPPPVISLISADGAWLLHTRWAHRQRLTGFRATPFGLAAIAEGQPKISDLFTGLGAQGPIVGIAVPVFAPAEGDTKGRVIGGIGISIPRERLLSIVQEAGLPPGAIASVLDRKGVVVARSYRDRETVGRSPDAPLLTTLLGADAGLVVPPAITFENIPSTIAFARAPMAQYIIKLDVPEEVFLAPLRNSLFRSATIGIVVLIVGLVLALSCARKISAAFRVALGTASDVAGAPGAPRVSTGVTEADQLASLLRAAITERERVTRNAQTMFERSPVGIVIFDTQGRVHAANDAFLSIVGNAEGEPWDGIFPWDGMAPPSGLTRDGNGWPEVLSGGHCAPYEKTYLRPDGRTVQVLVSFGFTDRAKGMMAAFIVDLTEQRLHEAAHREAEEQLLFSLKAGRLGAWDMDLATRRIRCSDMAQHLYGRVLDQEVTLDQLLEVVHPEDRALVLHAVDQAVGSGIDFHAEYRAVWPDGSIHWLEVRGRILQDGGRPARLAGVSAEITERKQAEAALRDSETRLRAITDTMPQIVWSTRADGFHDYYNQRWYDLTGTSPGQTEGDGLAPMFHPDDQARVRARWQHSLDTGEPYEIECRLRTADGTYRWMLGRALPIRDQQTGTILRWFGTCTDIEETVAAREALARSREELERLVAERTNELQAAQVRLAQAQRMEALGQLAGGIAHDFNNVLQAVQSGGTLLEQTPGDESAVRRHASTILEATERGAAITRRLLAFSRRGDLRAEPVGPAALHNGMRDILAHTLGDGVKVELDLEPDLPPMLADRGQLETVLVNLATNGRDAMAGIGTLTLAAHAETVSANQAVAHPAGLKAGAYVRLAVSDTGCGMDTRTLARASEPFFTTKPPGQGTGLGLAMARGFTEQSGGALHIASSPGHGTTVTLWFPVTDKDPVAGRAPDCAADRRAVARNQGARLLLVDDDAIVRGVTGELMESMGFIVRQAESAASALAIIATGVEVDILVSDLSMPDMDGVALIQEARRRRPGLPAILLTGFADSVSEAMLDDPAGGGFSLLRKPVKGHQLAELVYDLLEPATAAC